MNLDVESFLTRWKDAGASERANCSLFLTELCDLIGVPHPEPSQALNENNGYVFEKALKHTRPDGTQEDRRIDLYKRGCFVLEAKQGVNSADYRIGHGVRGSLRYDINMNKAKDQAERYVRDLPNSEGWVPFIIVVDLGHHIELYSDFSRTGRNHEAFPDPSRRRIPFSDLHKPEVIELLRTVWTNPASLDPAIRSVAVTRDLATQLGELAKNLEHGGHSPATVAHFLQRALFTMFAEDVGLLPERSFTGLLQDLSEEPSIARDMLTDLWKTMDSGGFSTILRKRIVRFNGGLFAEATVPELTKKDLSLLHASAKADWSLVEPAIFGTLLERALDPRERHKLGAHFTPRPYVERLVEPTVMFDLRSQWMQVRQEVDRLQKDSEGATERQQIKIQTACVSLIKSFHRDLCKVRVLDPACGSGNFLYVAFELIKRLEADVLQALAELGEQQSALALESGEFMVDPHQFLGIEINPRAAALAELVLWIGYLQWHYRTHKNATPREPVLHNYANIECRDALLSFANKAPRINADGSEVKRWDGFTTKIHPTTGEAVPDESATVTVFDYFEPKIASWPEADYIVGNPPFIGDKKLRYALGDSYVDALRSQYSDIGDSTEFVMYWWHRAAILVRSGSARRFGFITTNSIKQAFNRRVIQLHQSLESSFALAYVIPDHPWVDSSDGASVRIAMTVGAKSTDRGCLAKITHEKAGADGIGDVQFNLEHGFIHADLSIGANVIDASALKANSGLSVNGFMLAGSGFIVTPEQRDLLEKNAPVFAYRNGRDITDRPRGVFLIDTYPLEETELREKYPASYQWLWDRVKPERNSNNRTRLKNVWWQFGEVRKGFRIARKGIARYIVTVETAKHRLFVFLDSNTAPDHMLIAITLPDAFHLGVLSSRIHVTWALSAGGTLEDRPRYNKSRCFDPFPFPDCSEIQKEKIRKLGESIDAHRKQQQSLHSDLTLTGMYNVLEKLKTGDVLTLKEKAIHEHGLVSVLAQLHQELDIAVAEAYGWPANIANEDILVRLVDLNKARQAEEAQGNIRWLRPEYQCYQKDEDSSEIAPQEWPSNMKDQILAVRKLKEEAVIPVTVEILEKTFPSASREVLAQVLETLSIL